MSETLVNMFLLTNLLGGLRTAAELGDLCGISFPSPSPLSSRGMVSETSLPSTGVLSLGPLLTRLCGGGSVSGGFTCFDTVNICSYEK